MATTQARLGILRLNAGRLNAAGPALVSTPKPPNATLAGPLVLSWTAASGPNVVYDVYYGTSTTPPLVASGRTVPNYTLPTPPTAGLAYYWRIIARNPLGTTPGPLWYFSAAAPTAPILISPANGAIDATRTPTLTWNAVTTTPDIVYDVYLGEAAHPPLVASGLTTTSYTPTMLAALGHYRCRIVARNPAFAPSSATWTFTTINPTKLIATIEGVDVTARLRRAGFTIRDILADTPNTCSFTLDRTAPPAGQEVSISLGVASAANRLFAGTIDTVDAIYEGTSANRAWAVTCQDQTYGFNRRKVRRRYVQQAAHLIAQRSEERRG